jgi:hypothetical protein
LRRRLERQIGRRPDDDPSEVCGEPQRDHVLRHRAAVADTRVEAAVHDVDHPVAHREFELDARVALKELREHRGDQMISRIRRHAEPDATHRDVAIAVEVLDGAPDGVERLGDGRLERLACSGQRDAAARSIEQPHSEPVFPASDGVAEA